MSNVFDKGFIDSILVLGSGKSVAFCGRVVRKIQTGYLNDYVLSMVFGLIALIIIFK
jgi:NADH-quinone oxidoreductase subunit L